MFPERFAGRLRGHISQLTVRTSTIFCCCVRLPVGLPSWPGALFAETSIGLGLEQINYCVMIFDRMLVELNWIQVF